MIRTIIIDDEVLARQRIRSLLLQNTDIELITECKSGREAIEVIQQERPDLIFLDIQMKDFNGFEVLEKLNLEVRPLIIFVTAYDQYAIKAFEYFAFDYLLKPFKESRFEKSLNKAIERLKKEHTTFQAKQLSALLQHFKSGESTFIPPNRNTLPIKIAGKIYFIDTNAIQYIEASGYYIEIFTPEKKHLLRESLTNMLEKLDTSKFVRIHRSTIINIEFLEAINSIGFGDVEVKMKDEKELRVSKTYKDELFEKLGI